MNTGFTSYIRKRLQNWERPLFYLMHRNQLRVRQSESMFQPKEQKKTMQKKLHEMEMSNFLDKVLSVMVVKMLGRLGRTLDEQSKNFSKGKMQDCTKQKSRSCRTE